MKLKLKKKHKVALLTALMLMSLVVSVSNSVQNEQGPIQNDPQYLGKWRNFNLYVKNTTINKSIFYLELQPGYSIQLRADPRESDLVESPPAPEIYNKLYSSGRVFLLFDPEDASEVGLAYTEMARFLSNRPFDYVFGTTETYEDEFNRTYPVKDPFNTTDDEVSIYLKIENQTSIELVNNTLVVRGKDRWDLVNAAGRIQLALLRLG